MMCPNCGEELDDDAVADAVLSRCEQIEGVTKLWLEGERAWFDWAVELADELGLTRGPVANPADADGWTPALLRDALARRLRYYAAEHPLPRESGEPEEDDNGGC